MWRASAVCVLFVAALVASEEEPCSQGSGEALLEAIRGGVRDEAALGEMWQSHLECLRREDGTGSEVLGERLSGAPEEVKKALGDDSGYIGCYKDDRKRDFTRKIGKNLSIDRCKSACRSGGWKFAALQDHGKECFCGNAYGTEAKYSKRNTSTTTTQIFGWRKKILELMSTSTLGMSGLSLETGLHARRGTSRPHSTLRTSQKHHLWRKWQGLQLGNWHCPWMPSCSQSKTWIAFPRVWLQGDVVPC